MSSAPYILLTLFALAGITVASCNPRRSLATDYVRNTSYAFFPNERTAIYEAIEKQMSANKGKSGFELLPNGPDALLRLIAMIESAEHSLDLQYYIIQDDVSGELLLEAILRAADRGVRVRILMDDFNRRRSDLVWPLLNSHPNIEIRVFNPLATRYESMLTWISRIFTRLGQFSRRMHNKIMIADNQIAVTGGRNLGNSYFDASGDFNFRDVDVMAVGPIIEKLSNSFDKYWNDELSFPLSTLLEPVKDKEVTGKLRTKLQKNWKLEKEKGTIVSQIPLSRQIKKNDIRFIWASAELAADSPQKIAMPAEDAHSKPGFQLDRLANEAKSEFIIVSPYFVPRDSGTEKLLELVKNGVKVRILTNSLASLDAVAAYVGYKNYRNELVEGGVDLYEMKPLPGKLPHSKRFSSSARNSLHAKIYVVDRRDIIIGSFNLDPRSISLNTEIALVIHSPELAQQLARMFEKSTDEASSYHIISDNGNIKWETKEEGKETIYEHEPEAGFWRKVKTGFLSMLPIENQL